MCFPFTVKMLQEDTSSRYVSVFASKYTTSAYPFCLAASCVVNTCTRSSAIRMTQSVNRLI